VTFLFINTTWVFFRAHSVGDALTVLKSMVDFRSLFSQEISDVAVSRLSWLGAGWEWVYETLPVGLAANLPAFVLVIVGILITQLFPNSHALAPRATSTLAPYLSVAVIAVALLLARATGMQVFLYFQF